MRVAIPAVLALAAIALPAKADSLDLAINLGNVLGSEQACGLSYDHDAIEQFIMKRVKADDMGFPGDLDLMTKDAARKVEEMSPTSLRAHCVQIRRIAKSYKFIAG